MSNKEATITKINNNTSSSEWASIDVELDNGDKGNILVGKVSENKPLPCKVGETIPYTIEDRGQFGYKIRIVKPQAKPQGKPSDNGLGMAVGAAINCTVQLICNGKVDMKDLKPVAQRIIDVSVELKDANKQKFQ
jgi:hypothetical protein